VSSASGVAGDVITIAGTNFSPTPANNAVTINGVEATVQTATATALTVIVPVEGSGTGPVRVTVGEQTATASGDFTYQMSVVSFTPASQWAGSAITITGAHFNAEAAANTVTLNGIEATVQSATANALTVIVPAEGSGTGPVQVTVGEQTVTASDFTYEAWQSVSAGDLHTCGLSNAGTVWCWGYNDYGQLGNGTFSTAITPQQVPQQVGTASDWISLEAGRFHTCGLRIDGTAWCWGWNDTGQLGNGTTTSTAIPQQVGGASDWISLELGYTHTCGLRADGTAWCWGNNGDGQLGNGTFTAATTPQQVGAASDWISLAAGTYHTCGLRTDGTAWCWGYNGFGQLGNGDDTYTGATTPQQVGAASDWISLVAGSTHTCGVRNGGAAWCWGQNFVGQLGSGATNNANTPQPTTPQQVGTASDWTSLTAGLSHTCGLRANGTAWCWGENGFGQLGDGPAVAFPLANVPRQVGTASDWINVTAGLYHTCGLRAANRIVWCWGDDRYGQLGGFSGSVGIPLQVTNPSNP
jgi:alpha-tubulin suppressor-like RCC1 family protein